MTVTYTSEVATVRGFGVFAKLLFRWRGSIYKLVWPELLVYILLYYLLRIIYDFALSADQQSVFEKIVYYCRSYSDLIPLSFVLGFYVSIVMTRWWGQYQMIPWPDNLAVFVSTSVLGQDDRARLMRRTIMRYVNLSFVIILSMISPRVKKRFPTHDHLVEAGFMLKNEKKIFDNFNALFTHPNYWMPMVWAGSIVNRARKEGKIRDDFAVKTLLDAINIFRQGLGGLLQYDRLSIPLVYTQVVTLAVYSFFLSTLMGAQYLHPLNEKVEVKDDFYVPWFTLLQFFFYMGWLKVAETLVNPFGEDDDDFDVNWLIDRHFQTSYLIVDDMHTEHPELIQDKYWDEICPQELPYTVATRHFRTAPHLGSTANLEISRHDQLFLKNFQDIEEETESDVGLSTPGTRRKRLNNNDGGEKGNIKISPPINVKTTTEKEKVDDPDNDSTSVLWVTPPSSLRRNSSILSAVLRQLNPLPQNPHKRLMRQRSNMSKAHYDSNQSIRLLNKKGSVPKFCRSDSTNSKGNRVETTDAVVMEDTFFHCSLESVTEVEKEPDGDSQNSPAKEDNKADI